VKSRQAKFVSYHSYSEWSKTSRHFNAIYFQLFLEYGIRNVQVNQDRLNDTQLLVFTDDVNLLSKNIVYAIRNQELYESLIRRLV
jgi:hypothetical protein